MKARDYLVSKGLAKPGRGRFSAEAKAELVKAISEGRVFSDFIIEKPTGAVDKPVAVAAKPAPNVKEVQELTSYRYDENTHKAVDANGNSYTVRSACFHCGYSLVVCHCASPRIVTKEGYADVSVVRK